MLMALFSFLGYRVLPLFMGHLNRTKPFLVLFVTRVLKFAASLTTVITHDWVRAALCLH